MIFKEAKLIYYYTNQNLWPINSVSEISYFYYLWFHLLYLKVIKIFLSPLNYFTIGVACFIIHPLLMKICCLFL